jgi:hypothetical protein
MTIASPPKAAPPLRPAIVVFAAAATIGAVELASFLYLRHASVDFVVARREREMPIYRLGETVDWRTRATGQLHGWARPEGGGAWTVRPVAALAAKLAEQPEGDLELAALVRPFVDERRLPRREVEVLVNATKVAHWSFDRGGVVRRTARIPASLVGSDGVVRIEFRLAEHRSPQQLGVGADTRQLGIALVEWRIDPAPTR